MAELGLRAPSACLGLQGCSSRRLPRNRQCSTTPQRLSLGFRGCLSFNRCRLQLNSCSHRRANAQSSRHFGVLSVPKKCQLCRSPIIVCGAGTAPSEEREGSHCDGFSAFIGVPTTGMAKFGSQLGGGATLEKSKLDLSREVKTFQPKTDDSGGGGDNGNSIINGGGGGDGDDGDDDDYFDDFGEGDGNGDDGGFFRSALAHLYDEASRNAVLQEWFRTMADLPFMLRQAASFGLLSSAQLVRFFSMDVRPNVTRFVTRRLPVAASRGIIGRLLADPAFLQKLVIEQLITISGSLYWEYRVRGDRFFKELDFVAADTLCLAGSNMALVWLISPNRSYGVPYKFDWQRMLHELPANVFDASGPQRNYTMNSRLAGFVAKTAELCAIGSAAGATMSGLGHGLVQLRRLKEPNFQPSVPVPEFWRSSGGFAVALGVASNLRYQTIAGVDRYMFDHAVHLWPYIASSALLRSVSDRVGEGTRLYLQGLPLQGRERKSTSDERGIAAAPSSGFVRQTKKTKRAKKMARGFEMSVGGSRMAV